MRRFVSNESSSAAVTRARTSHRIAASRDESRVFFVVVIFLTAAVQRRLSLSCLLCATDSLLSISRLFSLSFSTMVNKKKAPTKKKAVAAAPKKKAAAAAAKKKTTAARVKAALLPHRRASSRVAATAKNYAEDNDDHVGSDASTVASSVHSSPAASSTKKQAKAQHKPATKPAKTNAATNKAVAKNKTKNKTMRSPAAAAARRSSPSRASSLTPLGRFYVNPDSPVSDDWRVAAVMDY